MNVLVHILPVVRMVVLYVLLELCSVYYCYILLRRGTAYWLPHCLRGVFDTYCVCVLDTNEMLRTLCMLNALAFTLTASTVATACDVCVHMHNTYTLTNSTTTDLAK
jgi:hypothetical protein